jgi:Glycosyl transferase family 2
VTNEPQPAASADVDGVAAVPATRADPGAAGPAVADPEGTAPAAVPGRDGAPRGRDRAVTEGFDEGDAADRPPFVRRGGALVRRHWLFAVILLLGAVGRLLTMLAYHPALLYIDSYHYLNNTAALSTTSADPIGYPLFLRILLDVGDLTLVVAVQHLLGLAMGLGVYVLLLRHRVPKTLAALAAAPILLDAYQWQIEQNILSDSLFLAIVTGALVLLAWRARPGPGLAAAAGVLLGVAVTVRIVGEITVLPAIVFVALAAGPHWRRRLGACAALLGAFAVPLIGYVLFAHSQTGAYSLNTSNNGMLFGRTATVADCSAVPKVYQEVCPTGTVAQREAVGPDNFAHDADLSDRDATQDQRNAFASYVVTHQPWAVARAVGADFLRLFDSPHDQVIGGTDVYRWQFQLSYPVWPSGIGFPARAAANAAAARQVAAAGDSGPRVDVGVAKVLRAYQLDGGYTPDVAFAVAMLAGLGAAFGVNRRSRRSGLRLRSLLWIVTGVGLLIGADVFEFSWRYQLPALVMLPVGGALGLTALFGWNTPRRRRPPLPAYPDPVDSAAVADFRERYGTEVKFAPVAVVIAAYNEADGIGGVLDALPRECRGLDVVPLVVVDGASDATAEVAAAHGAYTCVAPANRGQGGALRLGYRLAAELGAHYIVTTDADGQYDAAEMPALIAPLLDGTADFVTGSRILGSHETTDGVRQLGCRVFAAIVTVLMRTRITDTSFGFRAMRAEVPAALTLAQPQYQSSELLIGVLAHGFRVAEVPGRIALRSAGESKKGNNFVYGARYARVVFGTWWRELRRRARESAAVRTAAARPPRPRRQGETVSRGAVLPEAALREAVLREAVLRENTQPSNSTNLITKMTP